MATPSMVISGVTTTTVGNWRTHKVTVSPSVEGQAWSGPSMLPWAGQTIGGNAPYNRGPFVVTTSPTTPTWTAGMLPTYQYGATVASGGLGVMVRDTLSGPSNGLMTQRDTYVVYFAGIWATTFLDSAGAEWPPVAIPLVNPEAAPAWWASGGHSPTHVIVDTFAGNGNSVPFALGSINAPRRTATYPRNGFAWGRPVGPRSKLRRAGQGGTAGRTIPGRMLLAETPGGAYAHAPAEAWGYDPGVSTGIILPGSGMFGHGWGDKYLQPFPLGYVFWPAWLDAPAINWTGACYRARVEYDPDTGEPYPVFSAPWDPSTTGVDGILQWYGEADGQGEAATPVPIGAQSVTTLAATTTANGKTDSGTWTPPWTPPAGARYARIWVSVTGDPPQPGWGRIIEAVDVVPSIYYPRWSAPSLDGLSVLASVHGEPFPVP